MKNNTKKGPILPLLLRLAGENLAVSLLLLLVILAAIAAGVLPPLVLEKLVNGLVEAHSLSFKQILLYFALLAFSGILDSGREVCITIFGQKVTHGLRSEMAAKLNRLPAAYFAAQEAGTTASRFVNDVNAVDALFSSGVISMIIDAGKIFSILAVIFSRSRGLGLLILLVLPPLFLLTRLFQKRTLTAQLETRAAVAEANYQIPETIHNIRAIRLLRVQLFMTDRYDRSIQRNFKAQEASNLYDALYSPIVVTISTVLIALLMVASAQSGGIRSFFGISVGTAVALISFIGKIFDPLENIGMEIQSIQSAVAGVRRVSEFLELEEMPAVEKTAEDPSAPAVTLEQVSFSYNSGERMILRDMSLSIPRGERVTLTGRTGAGKSTIFKLLMGLYRPQKGSVRIFGRKPEEIPEEEKRSLYGYVEQQFHPVSGSIADQISLGDPSVSREEIRRSLEFVDLLKTADSLEKGLDTPYSDRLFSQGQIQLLSIARAVVKNPRIMLMDEITANLDSATERQVLTALEKAAQNRTVLSISHRLFETEGMKQIRIGD